MLNYKHLHYFWAVAREGSVTGAARTLGISAQTISGQISRLEEAIGQALFSQEGRGLVLTEAGRQALHYADRIFELGEALQDSLRHDLAPGTARLTVGVADVVPKTVTRQLLQPALDLSPPVRLCCHEGDVDTLLADLALHRLDLVLTDRPLPPGGRQALQVQQLARCQVWLLATPELAARYREGFPDSLARAPMLMPTRDNVLRSQLDQWLERRGLRVNVVGEFRDGALMDAFGSSGLGVFPVPLTEGDRIPPGLAVLGAVEGVFEHYYAITPPRRMQHVGVAAVLRGPY